MGLADLQPRPNPLNESRYQPIGVVDIGSNSVRLVIYEGPWRHAAPLHNEKAICAIGRNMVSSGQLDESGMASALDTLARYRALCDGHGVIDVGAVATSAARDAANGRLVADVRRPQSAGSHPPQMIAKLGDDRVTGGTAETCPRDRSLLSTC